MHFVVFNFLKFAQLVERYLWYESRQVCLCDFKDHLRLRVWLCCLANDFTKQLSQLFDFLRAHLRMMLSETYKGRLVEHHVLVFGSCVEMETRLVLTAPQVCCLCRLRRLV